MNRSLWPTLVACVLVMVGAHGQGQDGDALLRVKRQLADAEIAALKKPYVGIVTSKGVEPGAELPLCALS